MNENMYSLIVIALFVIIFFVAFYLYMNYLSYKKAKELIEKMSENVLRKK